MKINSKLPNVGTTIFSVMSALANEHNAINLSQGFPNFPSDPKLLSLVDQAMKDGHNQYAPMPGLLSLRQRIAESLNNTYEPVSEITVTAGATQAIFTAITALVNPGDEVILFDPAYDCYRPSIELQGGIPRACQLNPPDFKVNWKKVKDLINSRTRMIMINTPHNPSGTVWSDEDMQNLQALTNDSDILILSDEVYQHIVFDGIENQTVSAYPELRERSLLTGSFGKSFHTTGWKIGYCCAPESLMKEFRKVHQFNVFSVNNPMQQALANYMSDPTTYQGLGEFYQRKRDLFLDAMSQSRFKFKPASGTYFQPMDYSEISSEPDFEFAKRITIEHKVASIPISAFNQDGLDQKQIRFCFAKTDETLLSAAEILVKL